MYHNRPKDELLPCTCCTSATFYQACPRVMGVPMESRYPSHSIRLEELSRETIDRLNPAEVRRPAPLPRSPPPVFGRRDDPIVLDSPVHSPAEPSHVIIVESPASPEPSPETLPVNTPTKRTTPSPPISPSKVRCEGPRYIPYRSISLSVRTAHCRHPRP